MVVPTSIGSIAARPTGVNVTPRRICLDHNAGAPLTPAARAAMVAVLDELGGNPSSIHHEGRAARSRLERARATIAGLCGGPRDAVVLTSGGTESVALGVIGLGVAAVAAGAPARVVVGATEHPAVHAAAEVLVGRGFARAVIPVDGDGRITPDALAAALAGGAAVVALAAVNHELGVVHDLAALAPAIRAAGGRLVVDAVAAAGRLALPAVAALADGVALSAHKLGGPAGAGALWLRPGVEPAAIHGGGHQERGRRPGTENLLGAVGFAAAVEAVDAAAHAAACVRAARLEAGVLTIPGARLHGGGAPRVGTVVNVGFAGARGDAVVMALDLAGVAASTGAACSSGSLRPSPVLRALGLPPEQALEAVRLSLGPGVSDDDVDHVLAVLPAIVARARAG